MCFSYNTIDYAVSRTAHQDVHLTNLEKVASNLFDAIGSVPLALDGQSDTDFPDVDVIIRVVEDILQFNCIKLRSFEEALLFIITNIEVCNNES